MTKISITLERPPHDSVFSISLYRQTIQLSEELIKEILEKSKSQNLYLETLLSRTIELLQKAYPEYKDYREVT